MKTTICKNGRWSVLAFGLLAFLPLCTFAQEMTKSKIVAKGAELQLLAADYKFTEGPAVDEMGNVYFTDQPNDRILKWSTDGNISTYMQPAGRANGLYFDHQGNLLAAADEKNELWRIAPDKSVTVLIDDFEGKRLNGPNDIWVDPKGGIYFTDPFYKRDYWSHSEKEIEQERVYYLAPDGRTLKIVADDLVQPNGIIGTKNGKNLYVADIRDRKTYRYDIQPDGSLANKTLFAEMGSDGMTIDKKGNVYLTGRGVTVFNKKGEQIEHIKTDDGWTANVTFGGKKQKTLFITATKSLYSLDMKIKGVR
ncbi:SMP-30/gluconolactonase/LRE family protein [Flavilitoribacter nigricans]|uniref:Gluconolactonase n=1 Tax=Flavilitoribacter nigricans (strain ATCC 23147 / DSM 23189 / NBRC 102662 / NCIMB 1420 / SS-2) TaxID=1122177 RepID=A0A2D0N9B7_FLAN2|nr:SMP-30/gluconolactonase/LRE family protein [Flavilitoribacter nigricans]PHN04978.1 gluconolactonase [Flavilitoribacter nigricans DSM 23189 = NBRC 102662]